MRKLLVVLLVGLGVFSVFYASFVTNDVSQNAALPNAVQKRTSLTAKEVPFGFPVRLKIPKISLDAPLEHIGLTPQGDLDAPKGPLNAGWYDHGPRPGEKGTAVIDGHYGRLKSGEISVFDNLGKLQKGDNLYVEDERGTTLVFVVREVKIYGQNENHADVFVSNDGKAHLNLITCNGTWDNVRKTYSNRLVVFADAVDTAS